jgi:hypothetical protein
MYCTMNLRSTLPSPKAEKKATTQAYLRNSDDKTNLPDLALLHDFCLTVIFVVKYSGGVVFTKSFSFPIWLPFYRISKLLVAIESDNVDHSSKMFLSELKFREYAPMGV